MGLSRVPMRYFTRSWDMVTSWVLKGALASSWKMLCTDFQLILHKHKLLFSFPFPMKVLKFPGPGSSRAERGLIGPVHHRNPSTEHRTRVPAGFPWNMWTKQVNREEQTQEQKLQRFQASCLGTLPCECVSQHTSLSVVAIGTAD